MRGRETNLQDEIRRAKGDTIAAHATFTHHFNTFLALADQLDDRCQDIEDREEDMEKREAQGKLEDQQLQEREQRCTEREHEMEEREREVKAKEHQWAETESMIKASANKLPTVIKLDVSMLHFLQSFLLVSPSPPLTLFPSHHPLPLDLSFSNPESLLTVPLFFFFFFFFLLLLHIAFYSGGTKFSVSKEKLLQYKGSLFEQMVASSHCQQLSSGKYVILNILFTLPFLNSLLILFLTGCIQAIHREGSKVLPIHCSLPTEWHSRTPAR